MKAVIYSRVNNINNGFGRTTEEQYNTCNALCENMNIKVMERFNDTTSSVKGTLSVLLEICRIIRDKSTTESPIMLIISDLTRIARTKEVAEKIYEIIKYPDGRVPIICCNFYGLMLMYPLYTFLLDLYKLIEDDYVKKVNLFKKE